MIIERKDPWSRKNHLADVVHNIGNTDYLKNGEVQTGAPALCVLVTSQSDLDILTDYEPGTIAYTAGFANMWQKAANGDWTSIT